MANKHIISCSVTGLKCVCDTVSIPADNAGSILIKAKFTPEWDGLIISLAYRKVWGDSETTGEASFDGGELDAKNLFLCSDYGNEEAIPASYVEFGFIGRSSGDTEGFIKSSSVCSVKLEDSAYISNPGVTADSLGLSSRLSIAESEANMSFKQVTEHKKDKNNPHGATAAQVGAYSKDEVNGYVTALYNKIAENKSEVEAYVLGLNKCINEVDSKYNTETANIRTVTQQAIDDIGKIVNSKAGSDHTHTAEDVGAYSTLEVDEMIEAIKDKLPGKLNHKKLWYDEIDTDKVLEVDTVYFYNNHERMNPEKCYTNVPFKEAIVITYITQGAYAGGKPAKQMAIANDGSIYERKLEFDILTSEYIFPPTWVRNIYTKSEIDEKLTEIEGELDNRYTKTETDEKLFFKAEKEHEHAVVGKVETPILLSKDNTTIIEGEEIANIYEKSLFTAGHSSFEIKVSGKIKLKLRVSEDGSSLIYFDGNLVGDIGGINYGYGTDEFEYEGEIKEKITIVLSIGSLDFQTFTRIDTTEKGFMSIEHLDRLETLEANQGDIDTALNAILDIQNSLIGGETV